MAKILVGTMALRDKDGNFLPSRPIYREVTEDALAAASMPIDDIARYVHERIKQQMREKQEKQNKQEVTDDARV